MSVFGGKRREAASNVSPSFDRQIALLSPRIATEGEGEELAWEGYRALTVTHKVVESRDAVSIYLAPRDKRALPRYRAGQYLTLRLTVGNGNYVRCYSLSSASSTEYYRITVKRIPPPQDNPHAPAGVVSNYLCDQLKVGETIFAKAPIGDFVLAEGVTRRVVMIAGGIGVTPLMGILNAIVRDGINRPVSLYYAVRSRSEVIMAEHLNTLAKEYSQIQITIFISQSVRNRANRDTTAEQPLSLPVLKHLASGELYPVPKSNVVIGRSDNADIVIINDTLSGSHVCLFESEGQWFVKDLGSSNGTYLNTTSISGVGRSWSAHVVEHDDVLTMAEMRFQVSLPPPVVEREPNSAVSAFGYPEIPLFKEIEGRLSVKFIESEVGILDTDFYICGPSLFMDEISSDLKTSGVNKDNIYLESYNEDSAKTLAVLNSGFSLDSNQKFLVSFAKSGVTCTWDAEKGSILELAELNGVSVKCGCRAGHCGSCAMKVRSGEVGYHKKPSIPLDSDTCLACTAFPRGNVVVEA